MNRTNDASTRANIAEEKRGIPDLRKALETVMYGRDERATVQSRMLLSGTGRFVCQISINVPGFPKRLDGDTILIKKYACDLAKKTSCRRLGEVKLENGAGAALLMLFDGGLAAARGVKLAAISIEDNDECGRAADIDVIVKDGMLSRTDFGLEPRRCLLCDGDSKECARTRSHTYEELRAAVRSIINDFCAKQE